MYYASSVDRNINTGGLFPKGDRLVFRWLMTTLAFLTASYRHEYKSNSAANTVGDPLTQLLYLSLSLSLSLSLPLSLSIYTGIWLVWTFPGRTGLLLGEKN